MLAQADRVVQDKGFGVVTPFGLYRYEVREPAGLTGSQALE